jgi:hypothetical protein
MTRRPAVIWTPEAEADAVAIVDSFNDAMDECGEGDRTS